HGRCGSLRHDVRGRAGALHGLPDGPTRGRWTPHARAERAARTGPSSAGGGLLPRSLRPRVEVVERRAKLEVGDLLGHLPGRLRRQLPDRFVGPGVRVPEVAAEVLLAELAGGPLGGYLEVRLDASLLDASALGRVVAGDGELQAAPILELDHRLDRPLAEGLG